MSQPVWKLLANLGDASPLEHGGLFLYVDETGIYAPEMERVEMLDDEAEEGEETYEIHRVILESCTFIDGVLSDNRFHPDHEVWFARNDGLKRIAESMDSPDGVDGLIESFCSADPLKRAHAWRDVFDYHGWMNGDEYPLTLTRAEAEERYAEEMRSKL